MTARTRLHAVSAAFFMAALAACIAYGPTTRPVTADNQTFFFMSERVASGVPPHVSNVNHKNALSTMLSGAAIAAGRTLGTNDLIAPRILTMTLTAATVAMVHLLTFALTRRRSAALIAAMVMLTFTDFLGQGAVGFRPKTFMAFFMVAALLATTARRHVVAAVAATMSFLCWQPAGLVLAALGAEALTDDDRRGRLGALAIGFAATMIAYEAYFAWYGAVGTQLFQEYLMASDTGGHKFPGLGETLVFILRMGHEGWDIADVLPAFLLVAVIAFTLAAALAPARALASTKRRPGLAATLLTATGAVAFTFIDHQAWPDLFFIQAFVAVAAGAGIAAIIDATVEASDVPRRALALTLVTATLALITVGKLDRFTTVKKTVADQLELVRQIDVLRDDHGPVWAVGCLHLLAYARQPNHTPIGILIDPRVRAYAKSIGVDGEYLPLDEHGRWPGVILSSRGGETSVIPWLKRRYRRVDNASFADAHIKVWVRRDPADLVAERRGRLRDAGREPL